MILSKTSIVKVQHKTAKYYEDKGYVIPRHINKRGKEVISIGKEIDILIEHLTSSSWSKVLFQCPQCNKRQSYLSML